MLRASFTTLALILSFGLGVAATLILKKPITDQSIPQQSLFVSKCSGSEDLLERERYVVITVPGDNEFYIGKNRVSLSEIPERIRTATTNEFPDERIVFIKGEPAVRYSTLSLLITALKGAGVARIELIPNKKKF